MTRFIREYSVCEGKTRHELIESVNRAIRAGWEPFGNIVPHGYADGSAIWTQPVVKYNADTFGD